MYNCPKCKEQRYLIEEEGYIERPGTKVLGVLRIIKCKGCSSIVHMVDSETENMLAQINQRLDVIYRKLNIESN